VITTTLSSTILDMRLPFQLCEYCSYMRQIVAVFPAFVKAVKTGRLKSNVVLLSGDRSGKIKGLEVVACPVRPVWTFGLALRYCARRSLNKHASL